MYIHNDIIYIMYIHVGRHGGSAFNSKSRTGIVVDLKLSASIKETPIPNNFDRPKYL